MTGMTGMTGMAGWRGGGRGPIGIFSTFKTGVVVSILPQSIIFIYLVLDLSLFSTWGTKLSVIVSDGVSCQGMCVADSESPLGYHQAGIEGHIRPRLSCGSYIDGS